MTTAVIENRTAPIEAPVKKPKGPPPAVIEKSPVLVRIDAGEVVTVAEAEAELDRLNSLVSQFRKGTLFMSEGQRRQLLDDQRRLQSRNELRRIAVRAERAERREARFADALGVGLAAIDDPAVMLFCITHALKAQISQRDLLADEVLKTVIEAADLCLERARRKQPKRAP